jgi:exodeoxyribonuclease X
MFIFLDTETTGMGAHDRLCQIAFKTQDGKVVNELFNPGRPISYDAMAVHHITNEMVHARPPFIGSAAHRALKALVEGNKHVMVAHNAKFDVSMLQREEIHIPHHICTMKLARFLDKEGVIPKYNLQFLRYFLKLNVKATPHDAYGDILVLEKLFYRIHEKMTGQSNVDPVADMIRISQNPVRLARVPFGKHKGMLFRDVPVDYLEWLKTTDLDEDLEFTVNHYLGHPPSA